jgi:hypothetical protein
MFWTETRVIFDVIALGDVPQTEALYDWRAESVHRKSARDAGDAPHVIASVVSVSESLFTSM